MRSTVYLYKLEDKRPIGRFLLALAEGRSGPWREIVSDSVPREGPSCPGTKIVSDSVPQEGPLG